MDRGNFLATLAIFPLVAAPAGSIAVANEIALPVELRGGRFFAVPQLGDGRVFACWLDTDGSGFIFRHAVERFALHSHGAGAGAVAALPAFAPQRAVPPITRDSGELPIFTPEGADARDPILTGFEAQLGGSWFADRAWRLDFSRGAMTMLLDSLRPSDANAPLEFDRVYPRTIVDVAGERLPMSIDVAASVDDGTGVAATSFVTRAQLERWANAHPQWPVERNVSPSTAGVDRITADAVNLGGVRFERVAFTTRPGDDVFAGGALAGKLGANAYAAHIVTIDYPNARLRVE